MVPIFRMRGVEGLLVVALVAASAAAMGQTSQNAQAAGESGQNAQPGASAAAQSDKPFALKPDATSPNQNHRLILKDGSYQVVREYQVLGERVRYFSQERGDWEELPASLVDWDATHKWETEHATLDADDASPGMQEAEDVDKEELAARNEQKALMPEVATGLELPNQDGVFVLDTFNGTPELVELTPKDLDLNARTRHGIAVLNPMAGRTAGMEIDGAHAKVDLHVDDPAIYLSVENPDDHVTPISQAITVKVPNTPPNDTNQGAHSPQSSFAIVKLDQRNAVRLVGAIHVSASGKVTQNENVIPTKADMLPGKHWLRIQPEQKLEMGGEYAVVEILSPTDISPTVWDFRVDPTKGDNPGSITPILQPVDSR
jgi:hypothetical protein